MASSSSSSSAEHVDRRYRYLRGLFARASAATVANHREKEWLHLCKALARISVSDVALPNRQAVRDSVKGCGDSVEALLKELDDRNASIGPPAPGKYCGAAAALLCSIFRPKSSNACFRGSGNCCGLSSQAMGDRGSSYCASGNTLPINCLLFGTLIVFSRDTSVATDESCETFDPSTCANF